MGRLPVKMKFDGKIYSHFDSRGTKAEIKEQKKRLRKKGYLTRVIKRKSLSGIPVYRIYRRKK